MLVSSAMSPSQKFGDAAVAMNWRVKNASRDCEDILMAHTTHAQPGTTFPPVRCSMQQFDELVARQAAKCHSESDLVSAWVLRNRHFDEDDDDDDGLDMASKCPRNGFEMNDDGLEMNFKEDGGGARGSMNDDDQDSKDSDLFFDFDIAPEEGMKANDSGVTCDTATSSEAAAGEIPGTRDPGTRPWDQKQPTAERSSPTAVISQAAKKARNESPLVSPDSLLEEPVPDLLLDGEDDKTATGNSNFKSDSSSEDEDEDGSPLTFVKGDCKHTVASSTLSSLVAMLEKESSRSKGRDSEWGLGRYQSELPTIAASPATPSFLEATDRGHEVRGHSEDFQQQPRTASPFGIRADSMPCLPKHRYQIKKIETQQQEKQPEPERQRHTSDKTEKKAKMRRASSLKASKSSGSLEVGRKLSVRFADVFGLDLANIKTFQDEVPKVPKCAYDDLEGIDADFLNNVKSGGASSKKSSKAAGAGNSNSLATTLSSSSSSLVPMFNQPGSFGNFYDLIRSKKVCLENAYMADRSTVRGTVRVQNLCMNKKVSVRYTTNNWMRTADLEAEYVAASGGDGFSDQFSFKLSTAPLAVGQKIQFCLRYEPLDRGGEFWDNNDGKNYVFQCLSISKQPVSQSVATSEYSSAPIHMQHRRPSYSNSGSGGGGTYNRYGGGSTMSHSPSVFSEDPWLRYL